MTVYRINRDDRRLFVKLLIPVLIENIINALFGIMDSAMLGKVEKLSVPLRGTLSLLCK